MKILRYYKGWVLKDEKMQCASQQVIIWSSKTHMFANYLYSLKRNRSGKLYSTFEYISSLKLPFAASILALFLFRSNLSQIHTSQENQDHLLMSLWPSYFNVIGSGNDFSNFVYQGAATLAEKNCRGRQGRAEAGPGLPGPRELGTGLWPGADHQRPGARPEAGAGQRSEAQQEVGVTRGSHETMRGRGRTEGQSTVWLRAILSNTCHYLLSPLQNTTSCMMKT